MACYVETRCYLGQHLLFVVFSIYESETFVFRFFKEISANEAISRNKRTKQSFLRNVKVFALAPETEIFLFH